MTRNKMIKLCNRVIEYSFYCLFLLVPWAFWKNTSELFELNKMWLTWVLTIITVTSWLIKMVLQRKILFQRTPLDIPIGLFLLSQIISTILSLDSHVSLWGYYSRFNGGLLSIASYILLYYAFLSNLGNLKYLKRLISLSLVSGAIVALWGLPSHFGYDPTCFIFRGTFDVSCWTADFLPKVRIFSTLGQPAWLAAYLAILIPIAIAYYLKKRDSLIINHLSLILILLFYVDLLFTNARSGFLGIWISLIFFFGIYLWFQRKKILILNSLIIYPLSLIIILTFIIGTPINQLNKFTLEGIAGYFQKIQAPKTAQKTPPVPQNTAPQNEGGTESGDIRMLVWEGAINAWKANPLFGTGVETFAFAYYKYKPVGQNLTSEWNFLYNKAHNEYLNYLATTGLFGLGTYLLMIGLFIFAVIKDLRIKIKSSNSLILNHSSLIIALLAAYVSILITNFFGFSIVITNVYLFMIPAFVFVLNDMLKTGKSAQSVNSSAQIKLSIWQLTPIIFILATCYLLLATLFRFWRADIAFALGYNLDRASEYQQAYPNLHKAVILRGNEPVFKDELSINDAVIAAGLASQKSEDAGIQEKTINLASSLAQEAINASNEVVSKHSNNAVFWKTRVRVFYTLSQVDSRYLSRALDAIEKASLLAPNDANIWYNLGVLYGQNNNIRKGISAMEKTVRLKPDYRDAYYALGLFYHTDGQNEKAIAQMQYILKNFSANDSGALESLRDWGK